MITEIPVFAYLADIAAKSKDPRTKTAALVKFKNGGIFGAYNAPVKGTFDFETNEKYDYVEHAERLLIYDCARSGHSLEGQTMYMLFEPCVECARAIIISGITSIVVSSKIAELTPDRWKESLAKAKQMLLENDVKIVYDSQVVGKQVLFNGEMVDI